MLGEGYFQSGVEKICDEPTSFMYIVLALPVL